MNNEQKRPEARGAGKGYESRDVNVNRVVAVGLIGVILLVIILVLLNEFFVLKKNKLVEQVVLKPQSTTLTELRAQEDKALNSYKVLDAQKRIYQIPVAQAMKTLADSAYQSQIQKSGEQNRALESP